MQEAQDAVGGVAEQTNGLAKGEASSAMRQSWEEWCEHQANKLNQRVMEIDNARQRRDER